MLNHNAHIILYKPLYYYWLIICLCLTTFDLWSSLLPYPYSVPCPSCYSLLHTQYRVQSTDQLVMDDSISISQRCEEALQFLTERISSELDQPAVAIICGSGLGGLENSVLPEPRLEVQYKDIPHFPQSKGMILWLGPRTLFIRVVVDVRSSAWPCWKALVWLTRILRHPSCSHVGKSPVSHSILRLEFVISIILILSMPKLLRGQLNSGHHLPHSTSTAVRRKDRYRCYGPLADQHRSLTMICSH